MKKQYLLLIIALLLVLPTALGQFTDRQLPSPEDTYVRQSDPTADNSASITLSVNITDGAYMKFDFSTLNIGNITNANFTFEATGGVAQNICIYHLDNVTWKAPTLNFNSQTSAAVNDTSFKAVECISATTTPSSNSVNITSVVKAAFANNSNLMTLYINGTSGNQPIRYFSLEGTTPYNLTINFKRNTFILNQTSPIPGSVTPGLNVNFSCTLDASTAPFNVTNATMHINNPDGSNNISVFFDTDSDVANVSKISFLHNLSVQGDYLYSCSGFTSGNQFSTTGNSTVTRDNVLANLTYFKPFLDGLKSAVNLTFAVQDLTSTICSFALDFGINTSLVCANDNTNTTTTFSSGTSGFHNVTVYANDSSNVLAQTTHQFLVIDRVNNTFNSDVIQGTVQEFTLTLEDTSNFNPTVTLNYNGSQTTASLVSSTGNNDTYSATINIGTIPTGSATVTRKFNWTFSGTFLGNQSSYTYNIQEQQTSKLVIINTIDGTLCADGNATLYTANLTFKDDNGTLINSINLTTAYFTAWTDNPNNKLNFTWNESHPSISSYPICIFPDYAIAQADVKFQYGGGNSIYAVREFNLQNHTFTNATQNFTLFLAASAGTSTVTITIQDQTQAALKDYLIKAILVDFSNNSEVSVDSQITDSDGVVLFELDIAQYYRFQISKDGILVHQTEPEILKSTSKTIIVNIIDFFDTGIESDLKNGITTTLSYSNVTGNVTGTWNDVNNLASQLCLKTYNQTNGALAAFSNQCDNSTQGTFTVHIGNHNQTTRFVANLEAKSREDGNFYILKSLSIDLRADYQKFGLEGLLWAGIITTLILMLAAAFSPQAVVAMGILSIVIFGYILNIYPISWGVLTIIIFIGIVFMIHLKK